MQGGSFQVAERFLNTRKILRLHLLQQKDFSVYLHAVNFKKTFCAPI